MKASESPIKSILSIPVIVAALGYFVDIYDLLLFSIVRKPSLEAIGLTSHGPTDIGLYPLLIKALSLIG
ncbi:MAG: MFS transporter, partial [Spirochaetia bacterium]|nr:MFS transporter [Spirochaetia bacterium]